MLYSLEPTNPALPSLESQTTENLLRKAKLSPQGFKAEVLPRFRLAALSSISNSLC